MYIHIYVYIYIYIDIYIYIYICLFISGRRRKFGEAVGRALCSKVHSYLKQVRFSGQPPRNPLCELNCQGQNSCENFEKRCIYKISANFIVEHLFNSFKNKILFNQNAKLTNAF